MEVSFFRKFWTWYEKHYYLNVGIAAILLLLQVIHLFWLTFHVVVFRLFGEPLLQVGSFLRYLIVFVDYTEVPSLIGVSLIYLNELRKKFNWRSSFFLILLNSQWIHLFWITDEFVVKSFLGMAGGWPVWLVWPAIVIDYFELPVMADIIGRGVSYVGSNINRKLNRKRFRSYGGDDLAL